jgi:hypothetical protein
MFDTRPATLKPYFMVINTIFSLGKRGGDAPRAPFLVVFTFFLVFGAWNSDSFVSLLILIMEFSFLVIYFVIRG